MTEFDLALVVVLNWFVAAHNVTYMAATWVVSQGIWILAPLLFVMLWFSGDASSSLDGPRGQHRQRVLALFLIACLAYLMAGELASAIGRTPPPASLLLRSPVNPPDVVYPAKLTSYWFALAPGILVYYGWRAGVASIFLGAWAGLLTIAVGIYYPSDVLAGILLGSLLGSVNLFITPTMLPIYRSLIIATERFPVVAYPILTWLLLDMTRQFPGTMAGIVWLVQLPLGS